MKYTIVMAATLLLAACISHVFADTAESLYAQGVKQLREDGAVALDRAVMLFEQSVALDPRFARARQGLADALVLKFELEPPGDEALLRTAIAHLESVLKLQPADGQAYFSLAAAHFDLGDERDGMRALRKAALCKPNDPETAMALGHAWKARGDYPRAVEAYQKTLALDSALNDARMSLGFCYGRMGKIAKAVETTEDYLESAPDDPAAINNLALLHEQAGRAEDAVKTWTRLKDLASAPEPYRRRAAAHLEALATRTGEE